MGNPIPLDIVIGGLSKENEDRSDFRQVPASDEGNEGYRDHGKLGSYATNRGEPFETPRDVRFDPGYGASARDLERGWKEPLITEHPAYQLENYKDRSSRPDESDVTPGNVEAMPDDWEFRNRNRTSRGFLTRPRIPTERG
jgi:hypothetical protein